MHIEELRGLMMGMATKAADGALAMNAPTTTSATVGAAVALPALPAGYVKVTITGTAYKLPFFN